MSKFFDNVTWPKVFLILGFVVILIVTRILFPEAADWVLVPIMELAHSGMDILRNLLGGTP